MAPAPRATFERRRPPWPSGTPLALTRDFAQDDAKRRQWQAFLRRTRLADRTHLLGLLDALAGFLLPPLRAAAAGGSFEQRWPPAGPWKQEALRR